MRLSGGLDLQALARRCNGYVGADLNALCKEAAVAAVNRIFSSALFRDAVATDALARRRSAAASAGTSRAGAADAAETSVGTPTADMAADIASAAGLAGCVAIAGGAVTIPVTLPTAVLPTTRADSPSAAVSGATARSDAEDELGGGGSGDLGSGCAHPAEDGIERGERGGEGPDGSEGSEGKRALGCGEGGVGGESAVGVGSESAVGADAVGSEGALATAQAASAALRRQSGPISPEVSASCVW